MFIRLKTPHPVNTGAGRGLGLGLVKELINRPKSSVGTVFAATQSEPSAALQQLVDSASGPLVVVRFDPGANLHGSAGIDVLINNVGVMPYTPDGIAAIAHNVTRAFLPLLERGAHKEVVGMGIMLGTLALSPVFAPFPVLAYKITKAALHMLAMQWANENAAKGFVFCVDCAGGEQWVKTDLGGDAADLTIEEAVLATLDVVDRLDKSSSGKLLNFLVQGWEKNLGMNQYDGRVLDW
ncbi:short chain oxidoreductase [Lasiosphaeria miniovina]|uniref:Short chain oxidoreductase n=1 Tax=Lasiosphaeria miniovina TaxID=1954250 RepID=A0AA40DUB1_9PEZI|nr:short chain oxidoreductase [Lasiosphaeria miniovina]KAK0713511.1 short chain oxidoreductase [Lasiosphaeria miniovina]